MASGKEIRISIKTALDAAGIKASKAQINDMAKSIRGSMSKASTASGRSWTEFFFKWKTLITGAKAAWTALRSAMSETFRFETTTRQFTFLLGNIEQAKSHMQQLKELGDTPPFSLDEFAKASKQMMVLSDGALGFQRSLKMVGDAAAATGVDIATMGHAVGRLYAFIRDGQPLSRAVMELRNMGVLSPEVAQKLQDMQKAGKSNMEIWQEVEKALGRYNGAMKNLENTSEGLMSAIGTKFTNIWRQFTDQLNKEVTPALKTVNEQMKKAEESKVAEGLGKAAAHPLDTIAAVHQSTDPARAFITLGKELWGRVKNWWNRPMSKEELSAQRSIAEKKLQEAKGPYARLTAQRRLDRIDRALQAAPTTAQREAAEKAKIEQVKQERAVAAGTANPFRKGTASYDMFEKGLVDATGKATDKWYEQNGIAKPEANKGPVAYWDKNGQATKEYLALVEKEKLAAQEKEKLEKDMAEARHKQEIKALEEAAAKQKELDEKAAADRERQRQKELTDKIRDQQRLLTEARANESKGSSAVSAAESKLQQAWGWYRNKDAMAAQMQEEKAEAEAQVQFEKDFARLRSRRRDWRNAENLSVDDEAVRRVAIAREEKAEAERHLAEIEKNTADLAEKLDELLAMK